MRKSFAFNSLYEIPLVAAGKLEQIINFQFSL